MNDVLRPRATWTYKELEELRAKTKLSTEDFCAQIGISPSYYTTHLKRGYQPVGKRAAADINAFVEAWSSQRSDDTPTKTQVSLLDTLVNLDKAVREAQIATIPGDAGAVRTTLGGKGMFVLRRLFTRCPKCRYVDEETFEFSALRDAPAALEQARKWLDTIRQP